MKKTNSKRSPPPSSPRYSHRLPEYKQPRDPVGSAHEPYRFRLEQFTRWIPNRSNTSTRAGTGKDRTNVRTAGARAVAVVEEKKNAGRRQLFICNDYHVGNASAGDRITPSEGAADICAKIRFCRATVLVIPLQENCPFLNAGVESTQSTQSTQLG